MGGFGMILGGAMSGWSDARLDEIKSEREARLQELEAQRQDKRAADERDFRAKEADLGRQHDTSMADRSEKFQAGQNDLTRAATRENREDTQSFEGGENQKTRDYQSGEADKTRTYQSGEADKTRSFEGGQNDKERSFRSGERTAGQDYTSTENQKERDFRSTEAGKARDASGDLITDDQGNSYSRTGSKATPLTGPDGKAIKVASGGKAQDKPAEVSTAEWLIQQGVATNPADAWKMVRSARSDPDKSRASIYKAWLDALTKGAMGAPDAADLQKQAQDATEKTLQYLDEEPAASGNGASQQPSGASEAIPSDPSKRTVGKTYTNKNGQKAVWKGNGWEIVQ